MQQKRTLEFFFSTQSQQRQAKILKQADDEEPRSEEEVVDPDQQTLPQKAVYTLEAIRRDEHQTDLENRDSSSQEHSGLDVQECVSSPAPRYWETILPPLPRRVVKIHPVYCQAEVPPWDPSSKPVPDEEDLRYWCGQTVWTADDHRSKEEEELDHLPRSKEEEELDHLRRSKEEELVGRGREGQCSCEDSGSVECVRFHVEQARKKLADQVGPAAFALLGMEEMGECVARHWSEEEQKAFRDVVRMNPVALRRNFWLHLRVAFPARSCGELVSYYFNVFVLRRREQQNRVEGAEIDSDDDHGDVMSVVGEEESDDEDDDDHLVASATAQEFEYYSQFEKQQEDPFEYEEEEEEEGDSASEDDEDDEDDDCGVERVDGESHGMIEGKVLADFEGRFGEAEDHSQEEQIEEDHGRLIFLKTEAEIMQLARLDDGGPADWMPPPCSSSAMELASTNGAMQEIFGDGCRSN